MEKLKKTVGRRNYVENGPEWGDSDIADSDGCMEINQERMRGKSENAVAGTSTGQEGLTLEFKIIQRFGGERGISMSPVKQTTVLRNQIGDIVVAKVLRDGNLMIGCENEEQRERAGRVKEIGKFKVISTSLIDGGSKWSKGVIWGVPVGVTMEEIKSNLKGGSLKVARRLQVTREGVRKDSENVLLEFEEDMIPRYVTLGFLSYSVREYVPKPLRCYNCQRFGHTAITCKGRRRCARCGEDHEYGQCNHEQPKCCNCGGRL